MENYELVNDEQELNDVDVIDAEVCDEEAETCENGLDGVSFALGAVAALLLAKGVKKVVNSEPVQNGISSVKTKIAENKQKRAAAKEAKKLKLIETTGEVKTADEETEEPAKVVNGK